MNLTTEMDSFAFIIHPLKPKQDVARKYPPLARVVATSLNHNEGYSLGKQVRVKQVREIAQLARKHGFTLSAIG